jgi:PAS domain S-box-containing protein
MAGHRDAPSRIRPGEAALQQFIDITSTGLVRNSADLRVLLVNRAYARLVGREVSDIVGRALVDVIGPDSLERIRPYIDRVLKGDAVEYEVEMPLADGGSHWLHVVYTPDRDAGSTVVGWVASITDITTQKQTEQELRERHRMQHLLAQAGELGSRVDNVAALVEDVSRLVRVELGVSGCGLVPVGSAEAWHVDAGPGSLAMVADASTDARTADRYQSSFAPRQIRAYLGVSLVRDGALVATFWVSDRQPRQWSRQEADTLRLVGELAWTVIERLRAEEALRASKDHLRFVTDHAPVLLVHCDAERRYTFVNLPYAARFGLRPQDVIGKRIDEIVGEAAYGTLREYIDRAVGGETVHFEQEVPYPYGRSWMECAYVPQRDGAGAVTGFVAAIQDVTLRRAAEETLRLSEERFRATFEIAAVGIAHVALDGRWLRVNDRMCEILGYSRERLLTLTFQDITHEADVATDMRYIGDVLDGRIPSYSMDKRYIRQDGSLVWATLTVSLSRRSDGSPDYFISVVEDITAKKAVEDAFREADQRKDEFLALLAHELRNPLSPIRTSMAILRTRPTSDPQLNRCRGVIDRQVTHMTRLLDDLLDVSRLSRGKLTLQRSTVALGSILEAAVEATMPLVMQRGDRVELTGVDDEILLDADAARLTQVFGNLLNNAAKYSDPGATIHVSVAQDDEWVTVRVRDPGIGIPPAMLDKVFDLFTQADAARTHAPGGLGIGLSLARRLVDMHQGTIAVASPGVNQGSEFAVRLPLLSSRLTALSSESQPSPKPGGPRRRILVVDDNADVADTHAMLLQASGHDVTTVYSGEAAVAAFSEFQPDLVLLDIGLPDITGHDVCRRIRSLAGGGAATIIAVTGWGQARDRERSMAAGFDRHLVKPVDPEALVGIAAAARRPRLQWPPPPES